MIDTRVLLAALSIRASLGHSKREGRGHLLLTSSVAGRRTLPGSLYSATKFAVTAMGEALRPEVAETDTKVTLIEPRSGYPDCPLQWLVRLNRDELMLRHLVLVSHRPHAPAKLRTVSQLFG